MNLEAILEGLKYKRVLIVGDICLDRWCHYDPAIAYPSKETGLPRIGVTKTETSPGAGGTVANNLKALGVQHVAALTVIGQDGHGFELMGALAAGSIDSRHVVQVAGRSTFTYTKLINSQTGQEDQARVDFVSPDPLDASTDHRLVTAFRNVGAAYDVILVADQAETPAGGVVTAGLREGLSDFAQTHTNKVVWIDSRERPEMFRNAIIKPNQEEADAACARLGGIDYASLRRHTNAAMLVVTKGGKGAEIFTAQGAQGVPTEMITQPTDICGAGDSFTAGAALAYAVTRDPVASVSFGNLVASITIMKPGTGVATPAELREKHAYARG